MPTDNTKRKLGTMPCEGSRCPSHDRQIPVVVFENKHGTLSYSCDWCGRGPYAKKGTGQHDEWMEEIQPFDKPGAPPGDPPRPAASAAPVVPSAEDTTAAPPAPPTAPEKKKGGLPWVV